MITTSLPDIATYLMIFPRVTGALMALPGLGDRTIPFRIRLLLGVALTFVLAAALENQIPELPSEAFQILFYIIGEALIGIFMGTLVKLIFSAIDVLGMIIGFQMGLLNAFVQNPVEGRQTPLTSSYLGIIIITLVFVMDLHHLIVQTLVKSYSYFNFGILSNFSNFSLDMSQAIFHTMQYSFHLALQLSAPFVIMGLCFYIGVGLLNRLMPQLQVFFIIQPFQIFMGFLLLLITTSIVVPAFIEELKKTILTIFQGGPSG